MTAVRSLAQPPPLRAKALPRTLTRRRAHGRFHTALALDEACVRHGVGSPTLAESLGLKSDREGSEARSGALPISAGEVVLLIPLAVAIDTICVLLLERIAMERERSADSADLRLADVHVNALRALLAPGAQPMSVTVSR